jgi:hypothetical protein
LRYWLTALGQHSTSDQKVLVDEEQHLEVAIQRLNHLLVQSAVLLVQHGFVSPEAWSKALICPDGMIHDAASHLRCASVQETCYQPTAPDTPRPCPAREKGRQGCDCATTACVSACRYATPRDPLARFIWYSGSNQRPDNPNQPTHPDQTHHPRGQARYGYRSLPLLLADPARRFSLILLDDFLPANQREEVPFAAQLLQLPTFYPDLHVDAVVGDAAFGYDVVLRIVYRDLHARRVIDLRAHEADRNKPLWPIRGYDDRGRPICPYGYALTANGFDFRRQRHKWACFHACRQDTPPAVCVSNATYPPDECPHLDLPYGQLINVSECFKLDGSLRLVRDVPFGTPAWKRLYHRARNASEGRNSAFERWHIKQLSVYGDPRSRALTFQADAWLNLTTLARLVREATAATGVT